MTSGQSFYRTALATTTSSQLASSRYCNIVLATDMTNATCSTTSRTQGIPLGLFLLKLLNHHLPGQLLIICSRHKWVRNLSELQS
jgi:hypothetical protein